MCRNAKKNATNNSRNVTHSGDHQTKRWCFTSRPRLEWQWAMERKHLPRYFLRNKRSSFIACDWYSHQKKTNLRRKPMTISHHNYHRAEQRTLFSVRDRSLPVLRNTYVLDIEMLRTYNNSSLILTQIIDHSQSCYAL